MIKYRSFFCLTLIFLFFTIPNIAFAKQKVYLLQNTTLEQMLEFGSAMNIPEQRNQTIQNLIDFNHLVEITPELARTTFQMTDWADNEEITLSDLPHNGFKVNSQISLIVSI